MDNSALIYGANGYSAQLILDELLSRNVRPVLAGRSEAAIKSIADKYDLPCRIFDVDDKTALIRNLMDIHSVLNCAGPFKYTARKMMEACIETQTNYLDITGEIAVLETARNFHEYAVEKGIVIIPGVGFDVIPSDCLAKKLSEQLPDAVDLKLGFDNGKGKISRGTWFTTLGMLTAEGKIRRNGKLEDSPIGYYKHRIQNEKFDFFGISIPWGDVSTAYYSTGIPDITVYLSLPSPLKFFLPFFPLIKMILSVGFINKIITGFIKKNVTGPSKRERDDAEVYLWGVVKNNNGKKIEEVYRVWEGYNLTGVGAALSLMKVMNGDVKAGTHTPSTAFGSSFMDQFIIKKIY